LNFEDKKMDEVKHWSEDRYWTDALEEYRQLRESGQREVTLDLEAMESVIFDGDGPAYKAMEAMVSVWQKEGYEGYRGAPRVMFALLMRLNEISNNAKQAVSS
jgi:hypothetical protein